MKEVKSIVKRRGLKAQLLVAENNRIRKTNYKFEEKIQICNI